MPSHEFEFLEWIRRQQTTSPRVSVAAGDDMAVLKWDTADLLLIGNDQVLDGVHFDSAVHLPAAIGRKVMNRNLSDCAAMACLPAAAVAAVALPRGAGMDYARELYLGLRAAADLFDCPIVGGDTASWPGKLVLSVTILGRSANTQPITRGGARPGDGIYVTGPLGGSILGRHMSFTPRIREARALAVAGGLAAMIDISDGLSRDLGHICRESGVGALIDASQIPIHPDAVELAGQSGRAPLEHALNDGEDYELLFTAAAPPALGLRIGTIRDNGILAIQMDGQERPLEPKGWEHTI